MFLREILLLRASVLKPNLHGRDQIHERAAHVREKKGVRIEGVKEERFSQTKSWKPAQSTSATPGSCEGLCGLTETSKEALRLT